MKTPGSKERGFTLPELLIVIVLLGIMAAIAIPVWWGVVESRNVDSAANQFAADLRLAHTRATNQLTDWRVVFRPDGSSFTCGSASDADYCLVRLSSTNPASPTPTVTQSIPRFFPGDVRITGKDNFPNDTTLPLAGYITGSRATLEFNSDGSAEVIASPAPTADPSVRVGASGNERSVNITRATSRVGIG